MKKSTHTIENENDRNAWLKSRGFDHNEFPIGEIRPEWEQFPIIKEYRNYQKSLKSLKTKKQNTRKANEQRIIWIAGGIIHYTCMYSK